MAAAMLAEPDERISDLSITAKVCHVRAWGHIWPDPGQRGYSTESIRDVGGVRLRQDTLVCQRKINVADEGKPAVMVSCGTTAVDLWRYVDGYPRRAGGRTYKHATPYHPAKVEVPEGAEPPERMTSAHYALAVFHHFSTVGATRTATTTTAARTTARGARSKAAKAA